MDAVAGNKLTGNNDLIPFYTEAVMYLASHDSQAVLPWDKFMSKIYVRNRSSHTALSKIIPGSLLYHSPKMLAQREERMRACVRAVLDKHPRLVEKGYCFDDGVVCTPMFHGTMHFLSACCVGVDISQLVCLHDEALCLKEHSAACIATG